MMDRVDGLSPNGQIALILILSLLYLWSIFSILKNIRLQAKKKEGELRGLEANMKQVGWYALLAIASIFYITFLSNFIAGSVSGNWFLYRLNMLQFRSS